MSSQARLRLFAWRKLFLLTAKKLVNETMKALPEDEEIRKQYVADALSVGGIAFCDKPDGNVRCYSLCRVTSAG